MARYRDPLYCTSVRLLASTLLLSSIKLSLVEWQSSYSIDRKEVTLGRLRIGHTYITHSFLLKDENWPLYSLPETFFSKALS